MNYRITAIVCLLLTTITFAADDAHPIKKLALAEADSEIALKELRDAARKFERSYDTKRERLNRQPDMVRRIIEDVRKKEEARDEAVRNPAVFDSCEGAARAVEDLWLDRQESLRELDMTAQRLRERANQMQESRQVTRQLAERWKDADLPLESLAPVFSALTAEAKKVATEMAKVDADLEKHLEAWATQANKTRDRLGVKAD